jgi:hypothetical protein
MKILTVGGLETKCRLLTDQDDVPLPVVTTASNTHDVKSATGSLESSNKYARPA